MKQQKLPPLSAAELKLLHDNIDAIANCEAEGIIVVSKLTKKCLANTFFRVDNFPVQGMLNLMEMMADTIKNKGKIDPVTEVENLLKNRQS